MAALSVMLLLLLLLAGGAGTAFYFWYGQSRAMRMEAQLAADHARMAEAAAVAALEETRAAQLKAEAANAAVTAAVVNSLMVAIQPDGQILVNGEVVADEDLKPRLAKVGEAKGSITIVAGPTVPTDRLAKLMQQAREAGISDVRLTFATGVEAPRK